MTPMIYNWYAANVKALRMVFGEVEHHRRSFKWILIHNYKLPECFNQRLSALLILTPEEKLTIPDSFGFFLNQKLVRTDGMPTNRLHDRGSYNPYKKKGYSRLSFHLDDFRPNLNRAKEGDTFIDICFSLYHFLGDARGVL